MMTAIPKVFCWSKIGAESGEAVTGIVSRKEQARVADRGIFLWGIGQSVEAAMRRLVDVEDEPEVLFTDMLSVPKLKDSHPSATTLWCSAIGIDGSDYVLPPHSIVTSHGDRTKHWALVCHSAAPINGQPKGQTFRASEVRNLGSDRTPGGSQVTTTVAYVHDPHATGGLYEVRFRARLVAPFLVRLGSPIDIPPELRERISTGDVTAANELRSNTHG